ncbi:MAG TPA: hypothetical protein VFW44_03145 [Bryobacteraceae bacterium]|nr:hypothetical protein [Bryobacteraceae bacterium]
MGNPSAKSAAKLLESLELSQAGVETAQEQPRDFHFAVTWVTLFAQLDLIESRGRFTGIAASASQALIPVVATPVVPTAPAWDTPGWEMTVPKMIRTGTGTFTRAEESDNP